MSPIPLVSIVGTSKTGKTTLIAELIPRLAAMGIKVAAIKHHHGPFDMDLPGKDTYRYKEAGAATTIIASPGRIGMVSDVEGDLPPREIVARYIRDVDLVLVEGYKRADIPKIEVYKRRGDAAGPVCLDDKHLIALVTDEEMAVTVPIFGSDDVEGLSGFIVSRILS